MTRSHTTRSSHKPANALLPERVDRKRHRHQAQVERQALTSHVPAIQAQRQAPGAHFTHLREPGETGQHPPAEIVSRRHPPESRHIRYGQRAWSNSAHVSAKDVDELRQLIEARGAQHAADARDSAMSHGAELEDGKRPPVAAEALLAEQNGPPVLQDDGACDGRHDRRKSEQARRRTHEVKETLWQGG